MRKSRIPRVGLPLRPMGSTSSNDFGDRELKLAIQALDSLNDQIVHFIFTPKASEFDVDSNIIKDPVELAKRRQQCEALKSSMSLMRRLLVDAQSKFRRMVEENKTLSSKVDDGVQCVLRELPELKTDDSKISRELLQQHNSDYINQSPKMRRSCGDRQTEFNNERTGSPSALTKNGDSTVIDDERLLNKSSFVESILNHEQTKYYKEMKDKQCQNECNSTECGFNHHDVSNCTHEDVSNVQKKLDQLEKDNETLKLENEQLLKKIEELSVKEKISSEMNGSRSSEADQMQLEVKLAKEALQALKQDRKRLKAEKFELLNEMKQLYGTLEDKENELRDFIRNYEQRMKDSDESIKLLAKEREQNEREKWNILKHARDEAERSVALCAQLGLKDAQIKQLQEELNVVRERLGYFSDVETRHYRPNGYCSPSTISSHNSNAPTPTPRSDPANLSLCSNTPSHLMDSDASPSHYSVGAARDIYRPTFPGLSHSAEEIYKGTGSVISECSLKKVKKPKESKGTWGSISRVFARKKNRKGVDSAFADGDPTSWSPQSSLCSSPLTEDTYAEKVKLLEEAQGVPMERWKAATVLAWIEISLGMPQYGGMCAENIKSGRIMLELNDAELESGLGITNVLHRRKLRLALDEHKQPSLCPYPKICLLTHNWVVEEWLPSLGLACYSSPFALHLIDGRLLNSLTKRDLEKHLGLTRKFHQVSIMLGIQLLRMMKFDKQAIIQRRLHCENLDIDPLVWTNQRFVKWAKSIDLAEYADNLQESGVHGALAVLESSFNADTMATALGIPASKNIIRRHLTTELDNLLQTARASLSENDNKHEKKLGLISSSSTNSLGRSFVRPSSRGGTLDRSHKRRSSMRESLSFLIGNKVQELQFVQKPPLSPTFGRLSKAQYVQKPHKSNALITITSV